MDLDYPLNFTPGGSVALTAPIEASHTKHLLDTYAGERPLAPGFGIEPTMFFSSELPELAAEQIRLAIAQYINADAEVTTTDFKDDILYLEVKYPGVTVNGRVR